MAKGKRASAAQRLPARSRTRGRKPQLADPTSSAELDAQIATLGLRIHDTLGDGNCLFRALSDQMYGHENHHLVLRTEVCAWLANHSERYAGFVDDERGLDEHLRCMRTPGTYGGHLELSAFAHLKKKNVKVVQPGLVYIIEWESGEPHKSENVDTTSDDSSTKTMARAKSASSSGGHDLQSTSFLPPSNTVFVAYHDWEHFSSLRTLSGLRPLEAYAPNYDSDHHEDSDDCLESIPSNGSGKTGKRNTTSPSAELVSYRVDTGSKRLRGRPRKTLEVNAGSSSANLPPTAIEREPKSDHNTAEPSTRASDGSTSAIPLDISAFGSGKDVQRDLKSVVSTLVTVSDGAQQTSPSHDPQSSMTSQAPMQETYLSSEVHDQRGNSRAAKRSLSESWEDTEEKIEHLDLPAPADRKRRASPAIYGRPIQLLKGIRDVVSADASETSSRSSSLPPTLPSSGDEEIPEESDQEVDIDGTSADETALAQTVTLEHHPTRSPRGAVHRQTLTRRQRKALGKSKPRAKRVILKVNGLRPGERSDRIPAESPDSTNPPPAHIGHTAGSQQEHQQWVLNGAGRVDVRGFRELKI